MKLLTLSKFPNQFPFRKKTLPPGLIQYSPNTIVVYAHYNNNHSSIVAEWLSPSLFVFRFMVVRKSDGKGCWKKQNEERSK